MTRGLKLLIAAVGGFFLALGIWIAILEFPLPISGRFGEMIKSYGLVLGFFISGACWLIFWNKTRYYKPPKSKKNQQPQLDL